jgi:NADH dehydrogenase [ubiquinone] 1 alpha subcomplex assembly factor 5
MTAPQVFDRRILRRRRDRAALHFGEHDFLVREVADRLGERLHDVNRLFTRVLDLGARDGGLKSYLRPDALVVQSDLSRRFVEKLSGLRLVADEEALPFAAHSFDLVISNLTLHWANDLPGALYQIRQVLRPDGLFLATLWGGETLRELRASLLEAEAAVEGGASPRVGPFVDVRAAGGLLQRAGFALPVVDADMITVTYDNAFALMRDLRGMGESNAHAQRRRSFSRRRTMLAMAEAYHARYADADGRIPATFQVIYLTGWAPHASQPKPLTPGSAKVSLKDVLDKGRNTP